MTETQPENPNANLSHQLRNALNALVVNSHCLLRVAPTDPERRSLAAAIEASAARTIALVEELLGRTDAR